MAKDIFELASMARTKPEESPECKAFRIDSLREAKENDLLKGLNPKSEWFERLEYLDEKAYAWEPIQDNRKVFLNEIVGSTHAFFDEQYAGRTWLEMLVILKKGASTIPVTEEAAKDATTNDKMRGIILYKKDGKYYVDDGNHRITYAKILGGINDIVCSVFEEKQANNTPVGKRE